jgi:hypothetical protein
MPEEAQEQYIKENQGVGTSLFNPRNWKIWYRNWTAERKAAKKAAEEN